MLTFRKKGWYFFVIVLIKVTFQEKFTDSWAITFREPYDINDFVNKYGLIHDGQIGPLLHTHLFSLMPEKKRNSEYNEFFSFLEKLDENGVVNDNEHSIIWFERQKNSSSHKKRCRRIASISRSFITNTMASS